MDHLEGPRGPSFFIAIFLLSKILIIFVMYLIDIYNMANQGDILKHRHLAGITVELVEPTNRGWKVIQREDRGRGKTKEKTAYFTSLDLFGDRRGDGSLFEPIKESHNMKHISTIGQFIKESKSEFQVYHNTYSSVIDAVEKYALESGYELDETEYGNAYVDAFFKPKEGQTKKDSFVLYKNGKQQRKQLHVQIYGMNNDRYELNMYIN